MKDSKLEEYNISRMTVEKGAISWEGHVVQIPGIVRVWAAEIPRKSFPFNMVLIMLMIALCSPRVLNLTVMLVIVTAYVLAHVLSHRSNAKTNGIRHVNLELCNGEICSFATENEAFAVELYETLKTLLTDGPHDSHYEILFENGGKIMDRLKPVSAEKSADIAEAEPAAETESELELELDRESGSTIMIELKKLHKRCTEKKEINNEILALIKEARDLTVKNDKDGLKAVFGRFVTLGLINDCNELGLDCLLQEIKSAIY